MNQRANRKETKQRENLLVLYDHPSENNKKMTLISELAIERYNLRSPSVRNLRIFVHICPFY